MIVNNVVCGGPALNIPAHLSFGQYVIDRLKEICANGDGGVALVDYDTGNVTTYKQLLKQIISVSTGLGKMNIKQSSIIGICSENRNEYIPAIMGAACFGATVTTLNMMYTEDEMKHVLSISRPSIIFGSEQGLERHLKTFRSMSFIERIIQLNGTSVESNIILYNNMMAETELGQYVPADVQGWKDTLFILYSSGTTGLPKGVMITHLNALYAVATLGYGYTHETCTKYFTVLPWYHTYGLISTMNFLISNKMVVYSKGFSPEKYLRAIEEHKVNVLVTAPPIVVFLAKSHLVEKYDMSSIKAIWSGAAPLSSETTHEVLKRMPNCKSMVQGYGLTEVTCAIIKDKDDMMLEIKHKPGSCGYPVPGMKVKVVNLNTRQKLKAYENGEICTKGPLIVKGYLNNEAATRDLIDEDGYLMTGDIGYYDHDGCFFIVDRLKELIKYKGHQVSPAAVESVVLQHAGVAECGVVGAPDELAGELPTAFVVAKPGAKLTEHDLLRFTDERLSPTSRLRGGIIFIDEVPKSAAGKILRRALKQKLPKHISGIKHA